MHIHIEQDIIALLGAESEITRVVIEKKFGEKDFMCQIFTDYY